MTVVKVQKEPKRLIDQNAIEDMIAIFCYHFPQYTFYEARKLPAKRVNQMLKVARREYAQRMYDLMQIVSAPHSKNMSGIKNILDYYKSIIEE